MENNPTPELPDRLRKYIDGQNPDNPEIKAYMKQGLTLEEALDFRSLLTAREAVDSQTAKYNNPQLQVYLDKMAAFNATLKKEEG